MPEIVAQTGLTERNRTQAEPDCRDPTAPSEGNGLPLVPKPRGNEQPGRKVDQFREGALVLPPRGRPDGGAPAGHGVQGEPREGDHARDLRIQFARFDDNRATEAMTNQHNLFGTDSLEKRARSKDIEH